MKTKWFKSALYLAVGAMITLGATSCSKDDPVDPKVNPDPKEKPGDKPGEKPGEKPKTTKMLMPASVEIYVYDGHLHGTKKFHQNSHAKQLKYLGTTYKLVYTLVDGKWVASKDNKTVNLLGDTTPIDQAAKVGGSVAAFDIHYFDKDHNEITGDYIVNGENKHYQHFFVASDIKSGYADEEKKAAENGLKFFGYEYCDTDPWNATNHSGKAKFVDPSLYVGMKGYFHFLTPYKKFNLEIKLMRAENKLIDGKLSSFCLPTADQMAKNEWLPSIVVPVNLFMSTADLELEAPDFDRQEILTRPENEFSERDRLIIHSVMDAYGIKDFHEAVAEFFWNIAGENGHDMDNFWF